jgi:hypothetical protein|nr:hypothetical protein [uncultured Oscillibacter sp.]
MVSNICLILFLILIVATPALLIASLMNAIIKRPVKKLLLSALCTFCSIFIVLIIAVLSTPGEDVDLGKDSSQQNIGSSTQSQPETTNECDHIWIETSREEPTEETQGISYQKCETCGAEQQVYIPKIEHIVTFDEIYHEYESNALRADEKYKNNRYTVTATINGMTTGGLFNLSGGATLTMETRVDNTLVFFYAEFEKDQEEALMSVNVGDEITFEGECLSAGSWVECELK